MVLYAEEGGQVRRWLAEGTHRRTVPLGVSFVVGIVVILFSVGALAVEPVITGVTIPDVAMKINDVVTATISVQSDSATVYTLNPSTIGGYVLGSLSKQDSITYTVTFTISEGGTDYAADIPTSVTLADGTDTNTWTTAISQANDPIDANAPNVASILRYSPTGEYTNANTVTFRVTFDEDMQNVDTTDFAVSGAASGSVNATSIATPDIAYDVTITGVTGDGELDLNIANGNDIQDTVGNPLGNELAIGTEETYAIDNTAPSEPEGLSPADNSYTTDTSPTLSWNQSTDTGGSGMRTTNTYRVTITDDPTTWPTPYIKNYYTANTKYTPTLSEGVFTWRVYARDNAGNNSDWMSEYTLTIDKTPPDVRIDQAADQTDPTNGSPVLFTVVFDEPINAGTFIDADVTIGGTATTGTVTVSEIAPNDATTFSVSVAVSANGTVTATIPADGVEDPAGNTNTASASTDNTVTVDTILPSVTNVTIGTNPVHEGHLTQQVTVTFDEAMDTGTIPTIGFSRGEIWTEDVASRVWSALDTVFTVTYTLTDNNEEFYDRTLDVDVVTVDVTRAKDAAGNAQEDCAPLTEFDIDTLQPTLIDATSTSLDGCYATGANIGLTLTFSEDVRVDRPVGELELVLDVVGAASHHVDISLVVFLGLTDTANGTYVVAADENSCDLTLVSYSTSLPDNLVDWAGNVIDYGLPAPGANIADHKDIVVNPTIPVIDPIASDETVECNGAGNVADLNTWLDNHGGASATDGCSGVTWSNDFTTLSDDCGETGSALVTFTATDACGSFSTTQATFTIEDTTPPSITTLASDETVECDGAGNVTELNGWLANHGGAVASDACCGTDVAWTHDFTALSDDCGETGSAPVTFTATDACGNFSTTQATFTIDDTTIPVINDLRIDDHVLVDDCCEAAVTFDANVTDNCCVQWEDVAVTVTLPTGNGILEDIVVNRVQNGQRRVDVTGSAVVRCVENCPARIELQIEAPDFCGNSAVSVTTGPTEGLVWDELAPIPRDDPRQDVVADESAILGSLVKVGVDRNETYRLMICQDMPVNLNVTANDSDNCGCNSYDLCETCRGCDAVLRIHDIVDAPRYGTVTILDAERTTRDDTTSIRYAPPRDFSGWDQFSYRIEDACGNVSSEATVYVEVIARSSMEDLYLTTCNETPVEFEVTATDPWLNPDDPGAMPFEFHIVTPPTHGVVSGDLTGIVYTAAGATTSEMASATIVLTYTPATDYVGRDRLTVQCVDPFDDSSEAVIDVSVLDCTEEEDEEPPPIPVEPGVTLSMILPPSFRSILEEAWGSVLLVSVEDGLAYPGVMSASWDEAAGIYVLLVDTEGLTPGEYQLIIPLGSGETVELTIELGMAE